MSVQDLLAQLRQPWNNRLAFSLVKGSRVRADFQEQLRRFYDLLEQAAVSGDATWLDPLLIEWAGTATESELTDDSHSLSDLVGAMFNATLETVRENLAEADALELLSAILPPFGHALQKAAHLESEARTAYLAQELETVQRKLEHLDRSKSTFIAVAAHELKTPLTLIEGYAGMVGDALPPGLEDSRALLQGIHTGIQRLREIVDDMIDVSLIDNDLLKLNFQPIWLNRILTLLEGELRPSLAGRLQTLTVHPFPGSDERLFADPERIYQLFRNLLTNAIKYTPDGGRITVDGRTLPGFVEVTVSDTGIGISAEDQAHIFEKFGQLGNAALHSSSKTRFKGGGPGLGLPITRGIIEAHGGAIWVESEGHDEVRCPGSTFHILLPIRTQPTDPKLAKLLQADETIAEEMT